MTKLEPPFGTMHDDEEMPFSDFNKEIIAPGLMDEFPNGAIGIRVDDNFYSIGALPYSYLSVPIQEIVKEFWPSKFDQADFGDDYTTTAEEIELVGKLEARLSASRN